MRRSIRLLALLALVAILPGALRAQGGLSIQGFGYPTGQLGSASVALGGATAELDPSSAVNPAALSIPSRYSVYMMFEPEYRRTAFGGQADRSTTMRFPSFIVTGGNRRFTVGASATTFLDRTWSNIYSDSQLVGGSLLPSVLAATSDGAITDVRAAASYWLNAKVQVGLGIHGLTGENRLSFGRAFPDSTGVGGVEQLTTINYAGRAVSMGAIFLPTKVLAIGASARLGAGMNARQDELPLSDARVPNRIGLTLAYTGIPNTTIAARVERTGWSSMRELGTANMSVFDATDMGLGLEVVGPRMGGAPSYARLGLRDRGLPFGVNGQRVGERSFSGGIAIPVARGRGQFDISLARASRSAAGAKEKALFLSIGLGIRP